MLAPLSVVPSRQNPSTFSDDMDAFLNWLLTVYLPWANAIENSFQFTATNGTSTTSLAITTGSKSLTTQASKAWSVGAYVYLTYSSDVTKLMVGQVTAYNNSTGALTVNVTTTMGSGTYASWSIGLAVPDVAAASLSGGAAGAIPYQSGASTTAMLAAGAANRILQANGAAAPSWVSPEAMVAGADAAGANNFPRLSQVATLIAVAATTSQRGTVILASSAEVIAGADSAKPVTPATMQAGKIILGTAVATTSGTAVDFTGIPSWAKRITVALKGVSSSGSSVITVRLGTSGGIESTGYEGAVANQGASGTYSNLSTGFACTQTAAAVNAISGLLTIVHMGGNTWLCSGMVGYTNTAYLTPVAGAKSLGGVLDRIRLTTESGSDTFDAGSVNILYE